MNRSIVLSGVIATLGLSLAATPANIAQAQEVDELEEVVVTGSRIRRNPLDESVAIMEIGAGDIESTGLTNLADALQQLPISGSAINSQFNVPGNSGFPQDGSGIGAGAAQLAIRNVSAKRTLVLVDGKRWIAGASASGVPGAVDLNTIPDNVIARVEVLQDGASAIYGSDAIGGVVNIITHQNFEGFKLDAQAGSYMSDSDGESYEFSALWDSEIAAEEASLPTCMDLAQTFIFQKIDQIDTIIALEGEKRGVTPVVCWGLGKVMERGISLAAHRALNMPKQMLTSNPIGAQMMWTKEDCLNLFDMWYAQIEKSVEGSNTLGLPSLGLGGVFDAFL